MQSIRLTSPRAPAAYLLVGAILGIGLAGMSAPPLPHQALLAGALALAAGSLYCARAERCGFRWQATFVAAATLAFWAYGSTRLPRLPDADELALPPREQTLHLEVERIFLPADQDRYGRTSGIGRILRDPEVGRIRAGDRVYFSAQPADDSGISLARGSTLQATGVLHPLQVDEFSETRGFESYLRDLGIHYGFERTSDLRELEPPGAFDHFTQRMNTRMQDYLALDAPHELPLEGIYTAMLLGLKSQLSSEQKDRYRLSGTMHFFAISGLHIGVIAGVVAQALLLLRVPARLRPWIGLPLVYLYVEITGAPPSAMRAFLMAAFFWASLSLRRQRSPFAALIGSAVLVLIWEPAQLRSVGFQLSYTVVASILLFGLPFHRYLSEKLRLFPWLPTDDWTPTQRLLQASLDAVCLLFAISLSAWLASAPLSAGLFGFFTPGAVGLNMLLVHLAAVIITTGVLSISLGLLGLTALAAFVNHAAWLVLALMDRLVSAAMGLGGGPVESLGFSLPVAYASLALYFGLLLRLHGKRRSPSRINILLPPGVILGALLFGLLTGA